MVGWRVGWIGGAGVAGVCELLKYQAAGRLASSSVTESSTRVVWLESTFPERRSSIRVPYRWISATRARTPSLTPSSSHVQETAGLSWNAADDLATAAGGHLATITSEEEDDWVIANQVRNFYKTWLGGFQPEGTGEPNQGWEWVTGEAWNYTNWSPGGEPNNSGGEEDYLQYNDIFPPTWNDALVDNAVYDFIVEWDEGSFSFSMDCNANGIPDECDIADGTSNDINSDGVPDDCQCLADIAGGSDPGDGDGEVNVLDLLAIIGFWGSSGPIGDINFDGTVDVIDLLGVIDAWGACH